MTGEKDPTRAVAVQAICVALILMLIPWGMAYLAYSGPELNLLWR